MPRRPKPARPKGPASASFKPFAVFWCNGPIKPFMGHFDRRDPVFRGQLTRLFKTPEDARLWVVKQAIRGRFVGVLYERPKRQRLSHGAILERFNSGRGWWERPDG